MNDHQLAIQKWQKQITALWPACKGSLAKVYKPCIRKNCAACAGGEKHPAWILSLSTQGQRKTMYVPLALVAQLKKALSNGRKIELLLHRAGPELIQQHRQRVKIDRDRGVKS